MARPRTPFSRTHSTSTVGFPRESRTSLALMFCNSHIQFDEYDACWSAVGAQKIQRQRDHRVLARCNAAQVEAFDDDDILFQKRKVSQMFFGLEFFDREIIDSDKLNAALDKKLCAFGFEINKAPRRTNRPASVSSFPS